MHILVDVYLCVRVCVSACVRGCVGAWVRGCVCAWVRACVGVCVGACVSPGGSATLSHLAEHLLTIPLNQLLLSQVLVAIDNHLLGSGWGLALCSSRDFFCYRRPQL